MNRATGLLLALAAATLLIAGGVSYLASPHPDGLEAAALRGCEVVETAGGEELQGSCIAQNESDHALAHLPLADYAVGGDDALTGVAGVVGAVATFAVATAVFWAVARRRTASTPGTTPTSAPPNGP